MTSMFRSLLLLGLPLTLACTELGVDDTGASEVNLVAAGLWTEASGSGHDFHVLVENDGSSAAGSFQVRAYLQDSEPSFGSSGAGSATVSSLGAFETTDVLVTVSGSTTGQTAWVLVDAADAVDEVYEDDNVQGPLTVVDR